MTKTIDEKLKYFGWVEDSIDLIRKIMVYRCEDLETEVTLFWGDEKKDCIIFVSEIDSNMAKGLTCTDYLLFIEKIEQLKRDFPRAKQAI